jgi:hypothetical protein
LCDENTTSSKSLEGVIPNLDIPRQTSSFAVSERKSLVGTLHSTVDVTIEMILRSLSSDEQLLVMSHVRRNATFGLGGMRWTVVSIASETTNCSLQTAIGIPTYSGILARLSTSLNLNNPRLLSSSKSLSSFEKEPVMMTMT